MSNPLNSYSWKINHLIVRDQDPFQRIVDRVNYTLRVSRGDLFVEEIGEAEIAPGDFTQSFTDFTALTEELVMSWVMASFNVESLTDLLSRMDARLELVINPPLRISGDLPWDPNPTGSPDQPLTFVTPPGPSA